MADLLVTVSHLCKLCEVESLLLDVVHLIDSLLPGHKLRDRGANLEASNVVIALPRTPLFGWNDLKYNQPACTKNCSEQS